MANLTAADIERYKDPELEGGVAGLPPGYIEGFRPTLQNNLTVSIGGGVTTVDGIRVQRTSYVLRKADWVDAYTGGDDGLFYYVYLTNRGEYKVSMVPPSYSSTVFYYAHPAFDWRVIMRVWVDSDGDIKYASPEFRDTQRTVTVAPNGFVGEADYVCDGVTDEVWIKAAIEYADRVELLTGNFEIANAITITKENWEMFGSGAVIKPTAAIAIGDGVTVINNVTLSTLRTKGGTSYLSLFTANKVNSLVVDGCTFEMNTGFTATTCNYMAVRDCFFKGIEDYVGGGIVFTSCASLTVSGNSFRFYGIPVASSYSISCSESSGTIDGNTFFNSCAILLDATSDVAFSITGNDHQDPVLFWDEGDASYGPGVAYGSNTATA